MNRVVLLSLCVLLAACSSGEGVNRIAKAAFEAIRPGKDQSSGTARKRAPLTRAAVEASGAAMIRARLVDESIRSLLTAASENGGYVTFASRINQTLTLRGSLITASRGLGYDLLAVEASRSDPLVSPRPITNWPRQTTRTYIFPDFSPAGRKLQVTCRYEAEQEIEMEIVEVTYFGTQVSEFCEGGAVSFKNLHFAEKRTGFVRRSLQWLGPDQGSIDLEVIEPFTGE